MSLIKHSLLYQADKVKLIKIIEVDTSFQFIENSMKSIKVEVDPNVHQTLSKIVKLLGLS